MPVTSATTEDMVRLHSQCHEILKRVGNGSLSPQQVRGALQAIIEGKFAPDDRFAEFAEFDHLLLPLEDQLALIRRYNTQYWGGYFSEETLSKVETVPHHAQRLDDLEILHVQFGSLEETAEMWWKVLVGEHPNSFHWDELKLDKKHLKLWECNAKGYEPGIHLVRLNLVAYWEPDNGRTLDEVRVKVQQTGETLAQLEVMSAYGLHPQLLRCLDGTKLPYLDMPGTDVTVPGDSRRYALRLGWYPARRRLRLGAYWTGYRDYFWSAPVLR